MRCKFNNLNILIISIVFSAGIQSCSSNKDNAPDILFNVQVETNIYRFDKELFSIDTNNFEIGLLDLQKKYPEFSKVFIENVMAATDLRWPGRSCSIS